MPIDWETNASVKVPGKSKRCLVFPSRSARKDGKCKFYPCDYSNTPKCVAKGGV